MCQPQIGKNDHLQKSGVICFIYKDGEFMEIRKGNKKKPDALIGVRFSEGKTVVYEESQFCSILAKAASTAA